MRGDGREAWARGAKHRAWAQQKILRRVWYSVGPTELWARQGFGYKKD